MHPVMGRGVSVRELICGVAVIVICSSGVAAAKRTHIPVSIVGCVQRGMDAGTFVLANVQELIDGRSVLAPATYWLSSTKGLAQNVGRKLRVDGTYSPERDAGKTAKVTVETDEQTGEVKIALENGTKKVEVASDAPVGTAGIVPKVEFKRPYRRLEVESIRTVAPNCL
jgi:hypothetical protein